MSSFRNNTNRYISGQQGTAMRPNSSRLISCVAELNRQRREYDILKTAALRNFLAKGCGCCVDREEQDEAEKDLALAIGAAPWDDNSGYDLLTPAYKALGRENPSDGETDEKTT